MPIPQNGKTHSNNLLAICQQIIGMFFTILWDWRLKGCIIFVTAVITFDWQYPSANVLLRNSCLGNLRSSRLQLFFKIGVLNYSTNFTGKHKCCNIIKKRLQRRCFPVKFAICNSAVFKEYERTVFTTCRKSCFIPFNATGSFYTP